LAKKNTAKTRHGLRDFRDYLLSLTITTFRFLTGKFFQKYLRLGPFP